MGIWNAEPTVVESAETSLITPHGDLERGRGAAGHDGNPLITPHGDLELVSRIM